MSENTPVYGCDGCNTTGGRMSCPIHRPNGTGWLDDSFAEIRRLQAEIKRLQGLLAEQDREFNAENLRAERAEARVKELEGEVERCAGELDYEARHLRGVLSGEERLLDVSEAGGGQNSPLEDRNESR